jgi:hypothetical protein
MLNKPNRNRRRVMQTVDIQEYREALFQLNTTMSVLLIT